MNRVTGVYVRVSTADQRHDSQLRDLKSYCQQRGWTDVELYRETASGGKATRPQLDRLMKNIRAGKIRRVVVAVAEFERSLIRERVNAGLSAAKARGVRLGRPATLHKRAKAVRALQQRGLGVRAIGRKLRMPASSVSVLLRAAR